MSPTDDLIQRIDSRNSVIAVLGVGYVGLPLAIAMHRAGHRVLAVDTDPIKIDMLNAGNSYLAHLGEDSVKQLADSPRFEATADHERLIEADAMLVCVPTPLKDDQTPDLQYVLSTARAIGESLRPPTDGRAQLVVLESTTYPGTTRDEFLPAILRAAAHPDPALLVAYSPERENPGSESFTTATTPKLVAGLNQDSQRAVQALYESAIERVIPVESLEIAEAAKLLENVFRAVNIALVNELKLVLNKMGIDIWQVVRAASTKPFGFMPFYPGPGLGGHCIPIDPYYLAWKAKEVGHPSQFIELAGEINTTMPGHVVSVCCDSLVANGVQPENAVILIVGLAYKPDIDDIRESPSFELIRLFESRGASVMYHDPHVPRTKQMRRYNFQLDNTPLNAGSINKADAIVISTNHSSIDCELIARHARLVVDTRDAMRQFEHLLGDRLIRA